ncbi:MAG: alpha/beta hydrolase [Erysipelotrichaceae bacterium]|jgi:alpha-beta hydrolase superfamily lysophospholipase|nr:alpha/beta hydrolase [Erysipelotrichaceae bacterium]
MDTFTITLPNGEALMGIKFLIENGKANLVFITGMQEYAKRYTPLAQYLNKKGINVWILDHFGQGLNAPTIKDLQIWPKNGFDMTVDALHLLILEAKQNGLPTVQGGHSMGSFITQARLEKYPLDADKTLIVGSNGGQAFLMTIAAFLSKMLVHKSNWDKPNKFLASLAFGPYNAKIKNLRTKVDWLSYNHKNVDAYVADPYLGAPNTGGFWREFLKGMSTIWKTNNLKKINKNEIIYLTSGQDDPVGQYGKGVQWLKQTYQKLGIKNVTLKLYPNMRHEIHNEDGYKEVYADWAKFILD